MRKDLVRVCALVAVALTTTLAVAVENIPPGGGNRQCTPAGSSNVHWCCDDGTALACQDTLNGPEISCPTTDPNGQPWTQADFDAACAPGDPEVCFNPFIEPDTMIARANPCVPALTTWGLIVLIPLMALGVVWKIGR